MTDTRAGLRTRDTRGHAALLLRARSERLEAASTHARSGRHTSVPAARARAFAIVNRSERVLIPRTNRAATGSRLAGSVDLRLACNSIGAVRRKLPASGVALVAHDPATK